MDKTKPVWRDKMGRIVCQEELCGQQCDVQCPVYLKTKGDEKALIEQYDRAAFFYLQAVANADDYREAWEKLSSCYEKTGKTKEAAVARNKAVGKAADVHTQTKTEPIPAMRIVSQSNESNDVNDIVSAEAERPRMKHNDLIKIDIFNELQHIESLYASKKYSKCVDCCTQFDNMYGHMVDLATRTRIDSIREECEKKTQPRPKRRSKKHRPVVLVLAAVLWIAVIVYYAYVFDADKTVPSSPTITLAPKQSIYIRGSKGKIEVGEKITLEACATLPLSDSEKIQWSSSDSTIAKVFNTGLVKGLKPGNVIITAKLSDTIKATYPLEVTAEVVKQKNGLVLEPSVESEAPVTVHAPEDESCYVVFDPVTSNSKEKFSLFVNAGETTKVYAPVGTYKMYYAMGEEWYGRELKFGSETTYHEADAIFKFYYDEDYVYGTEVTLYKVENGNMETEEIDESEFPD